jgi:hypothetical protein
MQDFTYMEKFEYFGIGYDNCLWDCAEVWLYPGKGESVRAENGIYVCQEKGYDHYDGHHPKRRRRHSGAINYAEKAFFKILIT